MKGDGNGSAALFVCQRFRPVRNSANPAAVTPGKTDSMPQVFRISVSLSLSNSAPVSLSARVSAGRSPMKSPEKRISRMRPCSSRIPASTVPQANLALRENETSLEWP